MGIEQNSRGTITHTFELAIERPLSELIAEAVRKAISLYIYGAEDARWTIANRSDDPKRNARHAAWHDQFNKIRTFEREGFANPDFKQSITHGSGELSTLEQVLDMGLTSYYSGKNGPRPIKIITGHIYRCGFKEKLSAEAMAVLNDLLSLAQGFVNSNTGIKIAFRIEKFKKSASASYYLNPDSCWWGCYERSRDTFKANYGHALFGALVEEGLNGPQVGHDIFRAWLIPVDENGEVAFFRRRSQFNEMAHWIIFNVYTSLQVDRNNLVNLIAEYFGRYSLPRNHDFWKGLGRNYSMIYINEQGRSIVSRGNIQYDQETSGTFVLTRSGMAPLTEFIGEGPEGSCKCDNCNGYGWEDRCYVARAWDSEDRNENYIYRVCEVCRERYYFGRISDDNGWIIARTNNPRNMPAPESDRRRSWLEYGSNVQRLLETQQRELEREREERRVAPSQPIAEDTQGLTGPQVRPIGHRVTWPNGITVNATAAMNQMIETAHAAIRAEGASAANAQLDQTSSSIDDMERLRQANDILNYVGLHVTFNAEERTIDESFWLDYATEPLSSRVEMSFQHLPLENSHSYLLAIFRKENFLFVKYVLRFCDWIALNTRENLTRPVMNIPLHCGLLGNAVAMFVTRILCQQEMAYNVRRDEAEIIRTATGINLTNGEDVLSTDFDFQAGSKFLTRALLNVLNSWDVAASTSSDYGENYVIVTYPSSWRDRYE